jgi:hypothetical protein
LLTPLAAVARCRFDTVAAVFAAGARPAECAVEELADEAVESAEAMPYPLASAVPMPSAIASPPTRPMHAAERIDEPP